MTLVKFNPHRSLDTFSNVVDRFFEGENLSSACTRWSPATDVAEYGNHYEVIAELPGMKRDEIKVSLEDGTLTLSGEKKEEKSESDQNFYHSERFYGTFERSFRLPKEVKAEEIKAKYENGVLAVHIPKAEQVKPKEIEIK